MRLVPAQKKLLPKHLRDDAPAVRNAFSRMYVPSDARSMDLMDLVGLTVVLMVPMDGLMIPLF